MLSILDLYRIGIGPSSSHTVGPMRIANAFMAEVCAKFEMLPTARIRCVLKGSLALTGPGHGTIDAVILGLSALRPEAIEPDTREEVLKRVLSTKALRMTTGETIMFDPARDIELRGDIVSDLHPNAMTIAAIDAQGRCLLEREYFSVGGGFIATAAQLTAPAVDDLVATRVVVPHPFSSAAELLAICKADGVSIADVVLRNEDAHRQRRLTSAGIERILVIMSTCIDQGLQNEGVLPGGLQVRRRAPELWRKLKAAPGANETERLFDWLNCYAMAVNEENAAGGRVVTAPTNGAAGIIPSILRHYLALGEEDADLQAQLRFLATAGAIGLLYKQRASISGAEMGCQGEVGVACSMAAAGLAAHWGALPEQVACAAEIGIEHNLGLTCDPVGGLVQVPCIERNAIGAVKAANAARLALHRTGSTCVSLDQAIETMRQTGLDMSSKYKETSQGGLAVNVVEC